jgi:hypothetical protein
VPASGQELHGVSARWSRALRVSIHCIIAQSQAMILHAISISGAQDIVHDA